MVALPQNEKAEAYDKNEYTANGKNTWKRNEAKVFWGISYFAQDFSYVKLSGHYGITIDALNIGDSLFGFSATLSSFNYGLVDKGATNDLILFGPNVSYEVVPNLSVALPLQAMCVANFVTVVQNVYRGDAPSKYLGSFAPWILERYSSSEYVRDLVDQNFKDFIQRALMQYDIERYPVGVVGGFGYANREIIKKVAEPYGIRFSTFLATPIDGLVEHTVCPCLAK